MIAEIEESSTSMKDEDYKEIMSTSEEIHAISFRAATEAWVLLNTGCGQQRLKSKNRFTVGLLEWKIQGRHLRRVDHQ